MLRKINADGIMKIIYSSVFFIEILDLFVLFTLSLQQQLANDAMCMMCVEMQSSANGIQFVFVQCAYHSISSAWTVNVVCGLVEPFSVFNGKTVFSFINFITPAHFISVHDVLQYVDKCGH